MARLNEFFAGNAYALHRAALRRERLPECCRVRLAPKGLSVRFLTRDGGETLLPVEECAGCGRLYALTEDSKYLSIENLMRYDVTADPKSK